MDKDLLASCLEMSLIVYRGNAILKSLLFFLIVFADLFKAALFCSR